MGNNYFQFKQFRVEQDKCGMKVTTDACIQGAWTPVFPRVTRMLDIGTGTGLLSLMLAQRNSGITIDAIEFDKEAARQAVGNTNASPWKDRITILEGDVRDHISGDKYDLIISNPPFFNNSLLGDDVSKNRARHTLSLSYAELIKAIATNLLDDGYVSIMLPYTEYLQWKELAGEASLQEFERLSVSHTPGGTVKRVVGLFRKGETGAPQEHRIIIKGDDNVYTPGFTDLLSPFYLDL